jgi:anthranilate phosphoribosyltransferase
MSWQVFAMRMLEQALLIDLDNTTSIYVELRDGKNTFNNSTLASFVTAELV